MLQLVQGWPEPEKFDPDRMGPERKEDIVHAKNFLSFGFGPHYCPGGFMRPPGERGMEGWEKGWERQWVGQNLQTWG